MSQIRRRLSKVSIRLPLSAMIGWSKQPIFLPFYHAVQGMKALPHIQNLYKPLSLAEFEAQLDELLKMFRPISLEELMDITKNGLKVKEPVFHLSFDDGLREAYDVAMPILLKKGIPATFFLNSGFINNKGLFFRYKVSLILAHLMEAQVSSYQPADLLSLSSNQEDEIDKIAKKLGVNFDDFLRKNRPYLDDSQIEKLIANGFTIGAHSINHPEYFRLSLKDQIAQTKESLNQIVNQFDLDYRVFSFPFTDDGVKGAFFDEIKNDLDLSFSTSGIKKDTFPFHLHRTSMESFSISAKSIISAEYLYYLLKSPFGKNWASH